MSNFRIIRDLYRSPIGWSDAELPVFDWLLTSLKIIAEEDVEFLWFVGDAIFGVTQCDGDMRVGAGSFLVSSTDVHHVTTI